MSQVFTFKASEWPVYCGVYLMKDRFGQVLYVGKAKNLRSRLASYFRQSGLAPKTAALVRRIAGIETLRTETEKEALLLEGNLIKRYRPRYNIIFRDDKSYLLFSLDKRHDYPKLRITRSPKANKDIVYFGPFTSGHAAKKTWRELGRIFPLRKCRDSGFKNRIRPCLYYHIKQCLGPCVLPVDRKEYLTHVRAVESFLTGKRKDVLHNLHKKMKEASDKLEFERAAAMRDLIADMRTTVEMQRVVLNEEEDLDAVDFFAGPDGLALCVIFMRGGRVLDMLTFAWPNLEAEESGESLPSEGNEESEKAKQNLLENPHFAPIRHEPEELFLSFLTQFYRRATPTAPKIVLPAEFLKNAPDLGAIKEMLQDLRGGPVRLVRPSSAALGSLLELARSNAEEALKSVAYGISSKRETSLQPLLKEKLALYREPKRIEVVDISHLGGHNTRAGVIVFENGSLQKGDYRIYRLDHLDGSFDDFAALAAWTKRRLDSGAPWPDLLLIDGGKGQLNAVNEVLDEAGGGGLFEIASIAKPGGGRKFKASEGSGKRRPHGRSKGSQEDRIFRPGSSEPMELKPDGPEMLFLQRLRDEAHRFVITSMRKARRKLDLRSKLTDLPGIGKTTAKMLWERFGSLAAIRKATLEDLLAMPGLGAKKAAQILEALKDL